MALGAFRVLALLLLPLAPIASFKGYPLYPVSIFFSIPVRFTRFRYYLRHFLSRFYI